MERRQFIIQSGTVVTAAVLLSLIPDKALAGTKYPRRPDPDSFDQPVVKAIAWGLNAPSPHNTQSWKFSIVDNHKVLLYVDENVLLPATDPPSRQIHMGAGCFIETMAIAASKLGYKAHVILFPEGYNSTEDFGVKPVAEISLSESDLVADPLSDFIAPRQTNRQEYHGDMISEDEFQHLKSLAGEDHSELMFQNTDLEVLKGIFYDGLEIESRTFRTNEETRQLFRFSEKEMAEKGNGLSIPQMGYKGIMKRIVTLAVANGNQKKWHSKKSIDTSMKKIEKGIDSTRGVVLWKTRTNTYEDWVKTGRDFVRFALALTQMNLYAHPYNQAIQEYDEMKQVREKLDAYMKVSGSEKIQMIVRIGRASKPFYSFRKSLKLFGIVNT